MAYFSAEFGFHESVPNYSGGLGILSGDHCKSASDLDVPFIAFTLLYRHGYFRQQIDKEGWQESVQLNQNFSHLPISDALDKDGKPLFVTRARSSGAGCGRRCGSLLIGRITLYLLDTDLAENPEEDRLITAQLYGGDQEMRIQQEIVLGIGGVHALNAMGITPAVYHMNEGHAAFLSLELIRRQVQEHKLDFYAALQVVAAGNIFTTHTPVPAGNDAFPLDLMRQYFGDYPAGGGASTSSSSSRYGQNRDDPEEHFSMTILALRTSRHANGVSRAARRGEPGAVEEGVGGRAGRTRCRSPASPMACTPGPGRRRNSRRCTTSICPAGKSTSWSRHSGRKVYDIPDDKLWATHVQLKQRLVEFVARSGCAPNASDWANRPTKLRAASELLNPDVLTIGFARRFATYKRATLLLSRSRSAAAVAE